VPPPPPCAGLRRIKRWRNVAVLLPLYTLLFPFVYFGHALSAAVTVCAVQLSDRSRYWGIGLWLAFVYLYIFVCIVALVVNCRAILRIRRLNRGLNLMQQLEQLQVRGWLGLRTLSSCASCTPHPCVPALLCADGAWSCASRLERRTNFDAAYRYS
jgi:hypothetical protein